MMNTNAFLHRKEGYKTYVVPDDVGGRYSVLTLVGLLPIAVADFDIRELLKGTIECRFIDAQYSDSLRVVCPFFLSL